MQVMTEASETTSSPNPQPSFQRLHPAPCRTKPPFPALARAALELSNRTGWSSLAPSLRGISVSLGIWASDATVMGINRTAPQSWVCLCPPHPPFKPLLFGMSVREPGTRLALSCPAGVSTE